MIFWPSTTAWVELVSSGAKISPVWAESLLKSAPQESVRCAGHMAIAAAMLNVSQVPMGTKIYKERQQSENNYTTDEDNGSGSINSSRRD